MNHNKLFFIQTADAENPKQGRQCWLISTPGGEDVAQAFLVEEGWVDIDEKIVISSEEVDGIVDTLDYMEGETYIKIHN